MTEKEEFIAWTQSQLRDAETALHDGDAGPRSALWSSREPVSVPGAWRSAIGQEEVRELFRALAETFADCTSHVYEIVAAEVIGDMAFTAGYERTRGVDQRRATAIRTACDADLPAEDGEWKVCPPPRRYRREHVGRLIVLNRLRTLVCASVPE